MSISGKVIAAVKCDDEFTAALGRDSEILFDLAPNIHTIVSKIKKVHECGKKYYIHIDLAEGIGKDKAGLLFIKKCGADGIISTRTNMIKAAKEAGLKTVQRFFIVDSHSVETTVETVKISKADMIEVMPAIAYKVIKMLKSKTDVPIIAGGLIENEEETVEALQNGAEMVSTSCVNLWR